MRNLLSKGWCALAITLGVVYFHKWFPMVLNCCNFLSSRTFIFSLCILWRICFLFHLEFGQFLFIETGLLTLFPSSHFYFFSPANSIFSKLKHISSISPYTEAGSQLSLTFSFKFFYFCFLYVRSTFHCIQGFFKTAEFNNIWMKRMAH